MKLVLFVSAVLFILSYYFIPAGRSILATDYCYVDGQLSCDEMRTLNNPQCPSTCTALQHNNEIACGHDLLEGEDGTNPSAEAIMGEQEGLDDFIEHEEYETLDCGTIVECECLVVPMSQPPQYACWSGSDVVTNLYLPATYVTGNNCPIESE